jgi:hypothetical protein
MECWQRKALIEFTTILTESVGMILITIFQKKNYICSINNNKKRFIN